MKKYISYLATGALLLSVALPAAAATTRVNLNANGRPVPLKVIRRVIIKKTVQVKRLTARDIRNDKTGNEKTQKCNQFITDTLRLVCLNDSPKAAAALELKWKEKEAASKAKSSSSSSTSSTGAASTSSSSSTSTSTSSSSSNSSN